MLFCRIDKARRAHKMYSVLAEEASTIKDFYNNAKNSVKMASFAMNSKPPEETKALKSSALVMSYAKFLREYRMSPSETVTFQQVFGYTDQQDPALATNKICALAITNSVEMNWHKGVSTERGGFVLQKIQFIEEYMRQCVTAEETELSASVQTLQNFNHPFAGSTDPNFAKTALVCLCVEDRDKFTKRRTIQFYPSCVLAEWQDFVRRYDIPQSEQDVLFRIQCNTPLIVQHTDWMNNATLKAKILSNSTDGTAARWMAAKKQFVQKQVAVDMFHNAFYTRIIKEIVDAESRVHDSLMISSQKRLIPLPEWTQKHMDELTALTNHGLQLSQKDGQTITNVYNDTNGVLTPSHHLSNLEETAMHIHRRNQMHVQHRQQKHADFHNKHQYNPASTHRHHPQCTHY